MPMKHSPKDTIGSRSLIMDSDLGHDGCRQLSPQYIHSSRNIASRKCENSRVKKGVPTLYSIVITSTFKTQPKSRKNNKVVTQPLLWQVESVEIGESLYQPERRCHLTLEPRLQDRITAGIL